MREGKECPKALPRSGTSEARARRKAPRLGRAPRLDLPLGRGRHRQALGIDGHLGRQGIGGQLLRQAPAALPAGQRPLDHDQQVVARHRQGEGEQGGLGVAQGADLAAQVVGRLLERRLDLPARAVDLSIFITDEVQSVLRCSKQRLGPTVREQLGKEVNE